ncbi:hypothetical protein VPH35_021384 [Triticum aestivum]
MAESSNELKSLIQALMTRFDHSTRAGEKHLEAQLAFNTQVSSDLAHLRKQLDLTQADVDDVRLLRDPPASPTAGTRLRQPAPGAQDGEPQGSSVTSLEQQHGPLPHAPPPRLSNGGPPLLPTRGVPMFPGTNQTAAHGPARGVHYDQGQEYAVKPPKHDFPRFDGDAPSLWIDRCLAYFDLYRIPPHTWVTTASLYIEGHAAHWLQAFRHGHRSSIWEEFTTALISEFGPNEFEVEMHKLLQLRQSGSVAEYRTEFEAHMYHLLALDATLNPKIFVTQFLLGLRDDLRAAVRLQEPSSITRAAVLARIVEEEAGVQRPRPRIAPAGRPPPSPLPPQRLGGAPRAGGAGQPNDELARERQLRDHRRANGLCFKCGDRYSREHKCKAATQLLTIHIGDFGEVLSDDTVHTLDLLDAPEQ